MPAIRQAGLSAHFCTTVDDLQLPHELNELRSADNETSSESHSIKPTSETFGANSVESDGVRRCSLRSVTSSPPTSPDCEDSALSWCMHSPEALIGLGCPSQQLERSVSSAEVLFLPESRRGRRGLGEGRESPASGVAAAAAKVGLPHVIHDVQ